MGGRTFCRAIRHWNRYPPAGSSVNVGEEIPMATEKHQGPHQIDMDRRKPIRGDVYGSLTREARADPLFKNLSSSLATLLAC